MKPKAVQFFGKIFFWIVWRSPRTEKKPNYRLIVYLRHGCGCDPWNETYDRCKYLKAKLRVRLKYMRNIDYNAESKHWSKAKNIVNACKVYISPKVVLKYSYFLRVCAHIQRKRRENSNESAGQCLSMSKCLAVLILSINAF